MATLTSGKIPKCNAAPGSGVQELVDVVAGAAVANVDASSLPANGTIAAISFAALPANGVIGALTFSAIPTQAECEALRDQCELVRDAVAATVTLRDECENLRDALAAANTTINALLARFRVTGGHALIAD